MDEDQNSDFYPLCEQIVSIFNIEWTKATIQTFIPIVINILQGSPKYPSK